MRVFAISSLVLLAAVGWAQDARADGEATAIAGLRARAATGEVRLRLVAERRIEGVPVFETILTYRDQDEVLKAEMITLQNGTPVRRTIADGATVISYDLVKNTATWGRYGRLDPNPTHPKYRTFFHATLQSAARAQESEALRILDLALRPSMPGANLNWMERARFDEASSENELIYRAPADRTLKFVTDTSGDEPLAIGVDYAAYRPIGRERIAIGWSATFEDDATGADYAPYGPERPFRYLALPRAFRI